MAQITTSTTPKESILNSSLSGSARRIEGIITPMVTPVNDREQLDIEGIERLTDYLVEGGVSGIFLLGTSGEFASMAHAMRREFVTRAVEFVKNRVPVFVGISDTCVEESFHLADHAADAGADGLVVTAPYYYRPTGPNMVEYLKKIADRAPLPVLLYNMPENTAYTFELDAVQRVIDMPKFIGMKDSGGKKDYFSRVAEMACQREDFSLFMGPDTLLGWAMNQGASGGVNSGSNLFPSLYVDMYRTVKRGDETGTAELQKKIELLNEIYQIPLHSLGVPASLKAALSSLGICGPEMFLPFHTATAAERGKIDGILRRLSLLK